jgi:hypothetical protein
MGLAEGVGLWLSSAAKQAEKEEEEAAGWLCPTVHKQGHRHLLAIFLIPSGMHSLLAE